ncbi:MAG: hypothetical protein OEX12_11530 [Gammaproteobacteria bacterium]|nr:hypothetical protein [Gammaproteobacteria bacterium]
MSLLTRKIDAYLSGLKIPYESEADNLLSYANMVLKKNGIKVERCQDCPHCDAGRTMDAVTCELLEKKLGAYQGIVYPDGRDGIHPDCPYLEEDK